MKQVRLFLDLDGVVADFMQAMSTAHGRCNPFINPNQPRGRTAWDLEAILGVTADEFWKDECFDFWAKMPPMPDIQCVRNAIYKSLPWSNVCVLTTPTLHHECVGGKRSWVNNFLPEVGGQVLFGHLKHYCAAPTHILVDDKDSNIEKFVDAGGIGILYPRAWNDRHAEETGYNFLQELSEAIALASTRAQQYDAVGSHA